MVFPDSPRVRYGHNPLFEVVCQLRFPPVLRIDTELPSVFQDRIRTHFPEYNQGQPEVPPGISLPPEILKALAREHGAVHEFISEDGASRVVLHRTFLAFSVNRYTNWQDFFRAFEPSLAALIDLYLPAYFSRVGLRYRNRIDRKSLGLQGEPWGELLRAEIAGELADQQLGARVRRTLREVHFRLADDQETVRVVHGLEGDGDGAVYLVDADFFDERKRETGAIKDVLASFNREAGLFFRWCLQPRLHNALKPQPV